MALALASFVLCWVVLLSPVAAATAPSEMPEGVFLGVGSCAGSNCHGATQPWQGSRVRQDEYLVWQQRDPHAKSYTALFGPRAKRIARNLGLKNAHEAEACLGCHTHAPPPAERSSRFQAGDGVGCEACHGPGRAWLGDHVAGVADAAAYHALVDKGMLAIDDPARRAELCLGCHLGTERRQVTHRMMGAGHPRLRFELDTFTETEPAHFVVDDDYRKRKQAATHTRTWAVGQAVASREFLLGFADGRWRSEGAFPELTFYDCQGCHHPTSNLRWQPREGTDLGPGVPRINDSSLVMLEIVTRRVDPGLAGQLLEQRRALHAASLLGVEKTAAAAATLLSSVMRAMPAIQSHAWDAGDASTLLAALANAARLGLADYQTAEQETMAAAALVADLDPSRARKGLEACYAAVESDAAYDPSRFVEALSALAEAERIAADRPRR